MIINAASLEGLFRGFSTSFNKAFTAAPSHYADVAMIAPSTTRETTYAWLGQMPRLREWLGDRQFKSLQAYGYTLRNRDFEVTIEVDANDIEDDQYGVYGPLFEELGRSAAVHPDELIFELLGKGFELPCYDGQNFFDDEHPVDPFDDGSGVVSNMTAGAGPAWYLMDTSRGVRPLIFQKRSDYKLGGIKSDTDEHRFKTRKFLYGVEARVNAGFGLWQLAHGSKGTLDKDSYRDARAAMQELKGEGGRPLGVSPNVLVVPPELEEAGLEVLNAENDAGGATNVWKGTAKLIVTPWLAS